MPHLPAPQDAVRRLPAHDAPIQDRPHASGGPALDALITATAHALACPMAALVLPGDPHPLLRARQGIEAAEWPQGQTLLDAALAADGPLVVADVAADQRFASAADASLPCLRFFAGAPIVVAGRAAAVLCVMDTQPRGFGSAQRQVLAALALAAQAALEDAARRTASPASAAARESAACERGQRPDGELPLAQPDPPLWGPGPPLGQGTRADVSAEREAESSRASTRHRLERAMRIGRLGVIEFDLQAHTVDSDLRAATMHGRGQVHPAQTMDEWLAGVGAAERESLGWLIEAAGQGDPERVQAPLRYRLAGALPAPLIELQLERDAFDSGRLVGLCREVTDAAREAPAERPSRRQNEFVSRLSHELRTPLHAMMGFVELLHSDSAPPLAEQQRHWSGQALEAGSHLLSLVNDLLDLTRAELEHHQRAPEPVAAALALDKVRGLLQPMAAERGVTLEAPHGALGLRLLAQPRTLTQALFNLLANAIKYNREGGRVRCRIEPRGARQGAIVVCDDGPGVAEADRARLFEPFERLARGGPDAQGSGLGLAITRRLVEAMGGSVDASFPAEGGTCVSIVLPLVDAPATADRGDAEPAAQPLAPRRRALLVARDAADAAAWRALFAPRCDWTLATLPAGPPWADEVRRLRPHLLLLDLPASQDMELTLLRAELGAEAPLCIALLSDHAAATVVQALRVGFDEAWTRPVAPAALQRRLDALGRDAAARRERGGV